ncbi:hypothetical protein KY290_020966 [Solanum tuberosum]|uniref:Endonuclease/exonuclease/phosphatase domain-containing protein n=1 Tax=Solanum tuberosum TaxID=4113 RepID=A0ABQ7V065_SOLTU|nr:hypothetical protein KY290_020966 [Solanum tuberosum]
MRAPWLICGDFNALLYAEDRLYGEYYTWTNKQKGSDRIYSRIDRALGNFEWMIHWGHVVLNYSLPNIYDHDHMMLNMTTQPSTKPPFRFFNLWDEHSSFLSLVEKEWQKRKATGHMKNIWLHLKSLKQKFAKLNQEEFKAVTQRLSNAKTDLVNIQEQVVLQCTDGLQN